MFYLAKFENLPDGKTFLFHFPLKLIRTIKERDRDDSKLPRTQCLQVPGFRSAYQKNRWKTIFSEASRFRLYTQIANTQVSCESISEHSWAPKTCIVNYLPSDSIDAENYGVVLRKSVRCQIKKKDEGFWRYYRFKPCFTFTVNLQLNLLNSRLGINAGKSNSVPSGTGIPRTGIPHQLPFVFWSVKTGYERSKVLMSAILETRWFIILVRIGSRKMSDRKAELERKRKRLEEIKKAREEKKKVRNAEGETISLIQYFTSWMWTANWFWRLGRNHSGFRDWLHVCDKCYAWETYLVTWNRYVRDFFNVEIRKTSVACICRLDGPVASLTLSRYM